jgi:hypothetical protein
MLARRFTLVCLAVALFGIGLAALAAKSDPPTQWVELGCERCVPVLL